MRGGAGDRLDLEREVAEVALEARDLERVGTGHGQRPVDELRARPRVDRLQGGAGGVLDGQDEVGLTRRDRVHGREDGLAGGGRERDQATGFRGRDLARGVEDRGAGLGGRSRADGVRARHDRLRLALVARGLLRHVDRPDTRFGSGRGQRVEFGAILGRVHVLREERPVLEPGHVRRQVLAEPLGDVVGLDAGGRATGVAAVAMRTVF